MILRGFSGLARATVLLLFFCVLLFSCAGAREDNDVYIGGYVQRSPDDRDKEHPDDYCAAYWFNGEQHLLGEDYESSAVNSITLVGDDLYCAGYVRPVGGKNIAVYWKNGEEHRLTDGTNDAQVNGIYVSPMGVLCAGQEKDGPEQKRARTKYSSQYDIIREYVAKCWLNDDGKFLPLSDGKLEAVANAVCADSTGNVYIAGYDDWFFRRIASTYESYIEPRFWKNGGKVDLWDNRGAANAIAWQDGSIYVGGWVVYAETGSEATYWQDGIRRELEDNYGGEVKTFAFDGVDVYAGGTNGYQDTKCAVYWKNGEIVPLTGENRIESSCNAMAVSAGTVYCAGSQDSSVAYWKDGKVKLLGSGQAKGIVVVRKKEGK